MQKPELSYTTINHNGLTTSEMQQVYHMVDRMSTFQKECFKEWVLSR